MKPVFQQIVCPARGDCLSACLASLLELSIDEVPPFVAAAYDRNKPHESWDDVNRWLADRGLTLMRFAPNTVRDWRNLDGQYALLSMPSQRFEGQSHMVVGQWRPSAQYPEAFELAVVHDPNQLNAPYELDVQPLAISFLIPKNPAHLCRSSTFAETPPTP